MDSPILTRFKNDKLSIWSKDLGSYESNERAKEILNEIFMKIEVSNGLAVTFKMPKQ